MLRAALNDLALVLERQHDFVVARPLCEEAAALEDPEGLIRVSCISRLPFPEVIALERWPSSKDACEQLMAR